MAAQRPDTVANRVTCGYTTKWSYGDSNPGPLACHESLACFLTRPYAGWPAVSLAQAGCHWLRLALASIVLPLDLPLAMIFYQRPRPTLAW